MDKHTLWGTSHKDLCWALFCLSYIDIDDYVCNRILKFADDTKIYKKVNSVEDIENLRTDLGQLISWSKEWQMLILFNIDKCRVMHFGYNNPKAVGFGIVISKIWMVCN